MLLSVFHFYYLGILRLAILLLRTFHRIAHTWKYGARSEARGDNAFWWNETISNFGGNSICSIQYLYDTTCSTGAGSRTYWVDGTASQCWNRTMWTYCLDACNPESRRATVRCTSASIWLETLQAIRSCDPTQRMGK